MDEKQIDLSCGFGKKEITPPHKLPSSDGVITYQQRSNHSSVSFLLLSY